MKAYSETNQLNYYNDLTFYRTVISAYVDYGAHVICYTERKLKTLEKDQIRVLKRLLKLNFRTQDDILFAVTNTSTIAHKLATVKTKSWIKLSQ